MRSFLVLFSLICLLTLFLSGCMSPSSKSKPYETTSVTSTPQEYRIELRQLIETPLSSGGPTRPLGRAGARRTDLFWTAKHLVTTDLERLVIKNSVGKECLLKHVRLHPFYDLALLQTITPCVSLPLQFSGINIPPQEVFYIDDENIVQKASLQAGNYKDIGILSRFLTPGMSGSPLFLANNQLMGIVSAQTVSGAEVLLLTPQLIQTRSDIQGVVYLKE